MPQKFKPYNEEMQDGRRKIPKADHEAIRELYAELKSQRAVAKAFNCSRKSVVYIIHPDRYQQALKRRREAKTHQLYYDKAKRPEEMRRYRAKKRSFGLQYNPAHL